MGVPGVPAQVRPLPTAIEARDGRLWFALTGGVAWLDPNRAPKKPYPPPVAIQSLTVDGKDYAPIFPLTLPAHTSSVTIRYSSVSLSDPEVIRVRFQLHEVDTGWSETSPGNPATYRNLSPGNYHFSVEASDAGGVWPDKIATVAFRILPAWYQTTLFRASCAAFVVMTLWGLYRYRLHRLAYEYNLRIEERVAERIRIARELHDTLLQTFQALMLRLQLLDPLLPDGKAKEQLELTKDRAAQAIAEGRNALYALRSNSTTVEDLAEAVGALGEELATESGTFRLVVVGQPRALHPLIRDELYRITREALRNAFRHARARHIEAEITYAERALQLGIRDDGVGIAPEILQEGREGHFGLDGIRERAREIGAKLSIWSRAGAGTEIELSVPESIAYGSKRPSRWRLFQGKGDNV
jgi:signal transduction histidine kinase